LGHVGRVFDGFDILLWNLETLETAVSRIMAKVRDGIWEVLLSPGFVHCTVFLYPDLHGKRRSVLVCWSDNVYTRANVTLEAITLPLAALSPRQYLLRWQPEVEQTHCGSSAVLLLTYSNHYAGMPWIMGLTQHSIPHASLSSHHMFENALKRVFDVVQQRALHCMP